MKKIILVASAIVVSGCAANSGVVPIGQDTYMVSRQAATGFSGSSTLKAEAFKEASAHCQAEGKVIQVVSTQEASPPFILGNYPKAEVQFMCLAKNDPAVARPKLQKGADTVMEIRRQ